MGTVAVFEVSSMSGGCGVAFTVAMDKMVRALFLQ